MFEETLTVASHKSDDDNNINDVDRVAHKTNNNINDTKRCQQTTIVQVVYNRTSLSEQVKVNIIKNSTLKSLIQNDQLFLHTSHIRIRVYKSNSQNSIMK